MSSPLAINRMVLEKFLSNERARLKTLRQAYEEDPDNTIYLLRLMGLRCAGCGKHVTGPNLLFFNFEPNVLCYECQGAGKKLDGAR